MIVNKLIIKYNESSEIFFNDNQICHCMQDQLYVHRLHVIYEHIAGLILMNCLNTFITIL